MRRPSLACSTEDLRRLSTNVEGVLDHLRSVAFQPTHERPERRFMVSQVAEMLRIHPRTFLEKVRAHGAEMSEPYRRGRGLSVADIRRLIVLLDLAPVRRPGTRGITMPVVMSKGGVGKTSTCVHLAQAFALLGYRVCLIDCDAQGSTSRILSVVPEVDVDEFEALSVVFTDPDDLDLEERQRYSDRLRPDGSVDLRPVARKTHWDGLDLIPAGLHLYAVDAQIAAGFSRGQGLAPLERLEQALASLEQDYDIILMDTAPALSFLAMLVLWSARTVLCPLVPGGLELEATGQLQNVIADLLEPMEQRVGHEKEWELLVYVLNRVGYRPMDAEIEQVARKTLGSRVLTERIQASDLISRSYALQGTVFEMVSGPSMSAKGLKDLRDQYLALARRLAYFLDEIWEIEAEQMEVAVDE